MSARWLWALVAWLSCPQLTAAEASAAEREIARSAMHAGDELRNAGDLRGALEHYRSAHAIMHVPTTGMAVAHTEAELMLLMEARSSAIEVINLPPSEHEPAVFVEARTAAAKLVNKLQPLVPSIMLEVTPSQLAYTIKLDGNELPAAARYLTLKANPGHHNVEVNAPGYVGHAQEISVAEGETARLIIKLERVPTVTEHVAAPARVPVLKAAPTVKSVTSSNPYVDSTVRSDATSAAKARAIAGFTVGGVLLLGGATSGIVSLAKTSRIEQRCDEGYCGQSQRSALSTANTLANVANIAVPLGLLGIGYALYELVTMDNAPTSHARWINPQGVEVRW